MKPPLRILVVVDWHVQGGRCLGAYSAEVREIYAPESAVRHEVGNGGATIRTAAIVNGMQAAAELIQAAIGTPFALIEDVVTWRQFLIPPERNVLAGGRRIIAAGADGGLWWEEPVEIWKEGE